MSAMTGDYPILLVEDDSNDALLLQRAFRRAALTNLLQVVTNGEQAMKYLQGGSPYQDRTIYPLPRLVILDLKLPGMSGLEFLKWVRSESNIKDLSVIILSSSRQTNDIDQAYELKAASYMAKPEGNFDGLAEMVKCLDLEKTSPHLPS